MTKQAGHILAEAPELSPIDALWSAEAEARIDAFDRGEMAAIPAKDFFSEIYKNG